MESARRLEAAPAPVVSRAPVMAVFSLAGGVGKTSLVATLGRALSARGERVLLGGYGRHYGLLPFFFGRSPNQRSRVFEDGSASTAQWRRAHSNGDGSIRKPWVQRWPAGDADRGR